jgi:hypothetical protein
MTILTTVFAPTWPAKIERLAYWRLWERLTDDCVHKILAALAQDGAIHVDGEQAATQFAELIEWIGIRDGVQAGEVHPDEIGADLNGDVVVALELAERRVSEALTALTGIEAVLSP